MWSNNGNENWTNFFSGDGNLSSNPGRNHNVNVNGTENTGTVEGNLASKISCQNCKLDVTGNLGCSISLKNSILRMLSCSKVSVMGKDNQLDISNENNLWFTGDGNKCDFSKNGNVKFEGNDSSRCTLKNNRKIDIYGNKNDIQASDNTKMVIKGNENVIKADENSKLTIHGDFNKLAVTSTSNHSFTPAVLDSKVNELIISYEQVNFKTAEPSLNYFIQYVKQAQVMRQKHQLGMFKFDVTEGTNYVDVNVDQGHLDDFKATQVQPNMLLIHGRKSGEEEQLKISGTKVSIQKDPWNFRVYASEHGHL